MRKKHRTADRKKNRGRKGRRKSGFLSKPPIRDTWPGGDSQFDDTSRPSEYQLVKASMRRLKNYRDHLKKGKSNLGLDYLTEDDSYINTPNPFKGALEALVRELSTADPVTNHELCADYVRRAHQSLVPILDMYEATSKGKDKSQEIGQAVSLFVENVHNIMTGEKIEEKGGFYFWSKGRGDSYNLIFCGPDLKGVKEELSTIGITIESSGDQGYYAGYKLVAGFTRLEDYKKRISQSPTLGKYRAVEAEPNLGIPIKYDTLLSTDNQQKIVEYCKQRMDG